MQETTWWYLILEFLVKTLTSTAFPSALEENKTVAVVISNKYASHDPFPMHISMRQHAQLPLR